MIQYARPSVDNLVNNLPPVLKSSRQFLVWNLEAGGKKVPLKEDGGSWGNYRDTNSWKTFESAIDLLDRRRAFGVGLVLPSPEQVAALLEFNLIGGLVAFDGDAKRSPVATPYHLPSHISDYIRSVRTYSEFSTSLKGLRALAFGTLPTERQNITKSFGNGTELSIFRGGWVTLSGLPYGGSAPTIEHRQQVIDHIIEELWPNLKVGTPAAITDKRLSAVAPQPEFGERFVLDWSRTASEGLIRQLIDGWNRTPKQLADIKATWELKRDWNHGYDPDCSMYTKRVVEEALWLRRRFGWTLQDVVDLVTTFCKKHRLHWSFGRAKKQISDGLYYIALKTRQRDNRLSEGLPPATNLQQTPTLTCNVSQIISEEKRTPETTLSRSVLNDLPFCAQPQSADTLPGTSGVDNKPKLSACFRHNSAVRDVVLQAISKHPGWVKYKIIAAETGMSAEAARKQLQRLAVAGLVDRDGKGRYRKHYERKLRKLKPCRSKPIPVCKGSNRERKTLSRSELLKRGWPTALIDRTFPEVRKNYIEKEVVLPGQSYRVVRTRLYWVCRIKTAELRTSFEFDRAEILRQCGR